MRAYRRLPGWVRVASPGSPIAAPYRMGDGCVRYQHAGCPVGGAHDFRFTAGKVEWMAAP